MAKDRMYRATPSTLPDTFAANVGNFYQIGGIVFNGNGISVIAILPGSNLENYVVAFLDETQWARLLLHSDDPQYLDEMRKAWLRKAQRHVSGKVQQQIWARDGFKCMYCGRKMGEVQLSIDHFWPLELGGRDEPSNYVSACQGCNREKANIPPDTYCARHGIDYNRIVAYLNGGNA